MTVRKNPFVLLLLCLCASCGAGAEKKPAQAADQASDAATFDADATNPAEETNSEADPSPATDEPSGPNGGRSPKDIVGAESTRFVLSFTSSEVGMKAEERCDIKYSSNPQKRNQCMKSASARIKEHVMQFEQNKMSQWVWTTSNQKGNTLRHLRQFKFTWGKETKNAIVIHPSKGPKVTIGVPNNYSISIEHPTHGRLVYDAKVTDN